MVSWFDRFLCWLGAHQVPPNCNPKRCVAWACQACGQLVPGGRL